LAVSAAIRAWLAAAGCALALFAAGSAEAQRRCSPVELIYDENEQIAESHKDTNADCRFDEVVYYRNAVAERAERDTDHDGRVDAWIYFEADGKTPACQDQDTNQDGKKDRWITRGKPASSSTARTASKSGDAPLRATMRN
jgi:hypothetical protein